MRGRDEATWVIVVFVVAALFVGVLLRIQAAWGHDGFQPLDQWYRSLIAPDGTSCCSLRDCAPATARIVGDQWHVKGPGEEWLPVAPEAVLRTNNPDGRPIACIVQGFVKCFIPPAST